MAYRRRNRQRIWIWNLIIFPSANRLVLNLYYRSSFNSTDMRCIVYQLGVCSAFHSGQLVNRKAMNDTYDSQQKCQYINNLVILCSLHANIKQYLEYYGILSFNKSVFARHCCFCNKLK